MSNLCQGRTRSNRNVFQTWGPGRFDAELFSLTAIPARPPALRIIRIASAQSNMVTVDLMSSGQGRDAAP